MPIALHALVGRVGHALRAHRIGTPSGNCLHPHGCVLALRCRLYGAGSCPYWLDQRLRKRMRVGAGFSYHPSRFSSPAKLPGVVGQGSLRSGRQPSQINASLKVFGARLSGLPRRRWGQPSPARRVNHPSRAVRGRLITGDDSRPSLADSSGDPVFMAVGCQPSGKNFARYSVGRGCATFLLSLGCGEAAWSAFVSPMQIFRQGRHGLAGVSPSSGSSHVRSGLHGGFHSPTRLSRLSWSVFCLRSGCRALLMRLPVARRDYRRFAMSQSSRRDAAGRALSWRGVRLFLGLWRAAMICDRLNKEGCRNSSGYDAPVRRILSESCFSRQQDDVKQR